MSKIVIGIHGLGNKPPKQVLQRSWKRAMREGLRAAGFSLRPFRFRMVYWSNLIYPEPLDPDETDRSAPLYDDEPYTPATDIRKKEPSKTRSKVLEYLSKQMQTLFLNPDMSINFSSITDLIIQRYFKDLDLYYCTTCYLKDTSRLLVKDAIRRQLTRVLDRYHDEEILLIAHSMGSIIAYDVLNQCPSHITVDTFVTFGSPLGIPVVMSKIVSEQRGVPVKDFSVRVPEAVTGTWYNFADLEDRMTVNYKLCDDFDENSHHVGVIDKVVYNNYEFNGNRNPHKSYGYLRTPELADVLYSFQMRGRTIEQGDRAKTNLSRPRDHGPPSGGRRCPGRDRE